MPTFRSATLGVAALALSATSALAQPSSDPRVGLRAGLHDAAEAAWNLRVISKTPPSEKFVGSTNSDLAFRGNYVFQGSYNGNQIWDISNPAAPKLVVGLYCPASQSDVSVYKNLLFVSAEGNTGRIDCGNQGVKDTVSNERIKGIRVFDITDVTQPRNVANVQTCRGSHTHSVLVDPKDPANVYVYVSGSAPIRSANELPGCVRSQADANTAEFRIEVIKVPLANPERAAIVSSPRIFQDLKPVARRTSVAPDDKAAADRALEQARARGGFIINMNGQEQVVSPFFTRTLLDSVVKARGGAGIAAATGADSAALRAVLPDLVRRMMGQQEADRDHHPGATQCHDITLAPGIGLAGGACEGYGLLIDIKNPTAPMRLAAVSDTNFSYWHSATFSNDGKKVLFSDEWGGGGAPKCRASDPKEWGADAIFTIENGKMVFQSYYKLPAAQTAQENCVAHNGSLIPIPGRDVMVQAFYQGGITVFDWTDPKNVKEIAFFDRGPIDSTRFTSGGSWSVYWYNGKLVSSEIARGLDIFELMPSDYLSQNEIDAANTVRLEYLNTQGQPKYVWPASFAKSRAFVDQLERSSGLSGARVSAVRASLQSAEGASGAAQRAALTRLATQIDADARGSSDMAKVQMLAASVRELASGTGTRVSK